MKGSLRKFIQTNTYLPGGVSAALFAVLAIIGFASGSAAVGFIALVGVLFSAGFCVFCFSQYNSKVIEPVGKLTDAAEAYLAGEYRKADVKLNTGTEIDETARAISEASRVDGFVTDIISAAANGDFTRDISDLPDDVAVTSGLKNLYYNMTKAFIDISGGAEKVNADGARVSQASQSLSQGVTAQASTVEQLASTVNEIRSAVVKNAENAREAHRNAEEASAAVTEGSDKMNELLKAMDDISKSTNEILQLNKVIEDIAFQTNILALNASVEAARAGDAGKGFAVVASEVKNLAVKSQEASQQTSTAIQSCVQSVHEGVARTQETAAVFTMIAQKSQLIGEGLNVISEECAQQTEAITQINIGVEQISGVIQSTSMTADECAQSAAELTGRSGDLREIVGRFRFADMDKLRPVSKPARKADKTVPQSAPRADKPAPAPKSAPAPAPKPASKPAPAPTPKPAPAPKPAPTPKPAPASAPKPSVRKAPEQKLTFSDAPKHTFTAAPKSAEFKPSKSAVITQPSGSYANAEFVDIPDNKY